MNKTYIKEQNFKLEFDLEAYYYPLTIMCGSGWGRGNNRNKTQSI